MSFRWVSFVWRPAFSQLKFGQHKKWAIPPLLLAAAWWVASSETDQAPSGDATARSSRRPGSETAPRHSVDRGAAPAVASASTSIVDDEDEEMAASILARLVSEMDVAELCDHLRDLAPADLRGEAGRLLVRRWVELDPATATRWVAQLDDTEARRELSSAGALAWSERDMTAALAWAQSLPRGESSERVINDLGFEIARTDPALSLDVAGKLPEGEARDALELHALHQLTLWDVDAAKTWAASVPPGNKREQALAAVVISMASEDAEGAARFLVEKMVVGPESFRTVIGVVQRWAQTDEQAVRNWVEGFPPASLRETARLVLAERMRLRAQ